MRFTRTVFFVAACLASARLVAQDAQVVADLPEGSRTPLSKDELSALLPGARVVSLSGRGNQRVWTNDPGGSFVASSNNATGAGQASTAQGKWHISDDGRYCVLLEWRTSGPEQWCRYLLRSGAIFYATKSSRALDEKVYKLEIAK